MRAIALAFVATVFLHGLLPVLLPSHLPSFIGTVGTALAQGQASKSVKDNKNHYAIKPGADWVFAKKKVPPTAGHERILASAKHSSGKAAATVVRINFPNTPAWRKRKHYTADVMSGLKSATAGFALVSKKRGKIGRVPILDVRYRRTHAETPYVSTRFIFFRTLTLIISVRSDRSHRAAAAKLARSLVPYL